jgi:hypothetical protein
MVKDEASIGDIADGAEGLNEALLGLCRLSLPVPFLGKSTSRLTQS